MHAKRLRSHSHDAAQQITLTKHKDSWPSAMREQCPQLLNPLKSTWLQLHASQILCELRWLLEHGLSCIHKRLGTTCINVHVIEPSQLADPQPGTEQSTMGATEGQIVSGAWHNAKVFAQCLLCAVQHLPCHASCAMAFSFCVHWPPRGITLNDPLWSLQTSDFAAAIWQKTSSTTCWLKTRGCLPLGLKLFPTPHKDHLSNSTSSVFQHWLAIIQRLHGPRMLSNQH